MKKELRINKIINGDCLKELKKFPDDSINLIVTSPPYADRRKKDYDGVAPEKYVEWFLPISQEFYRVLKPNGSLILNMKENIVNGERHTYVLDLILEIKKQGWIWTEEYIWHKKNAFPGKWPNRFRDSWERCLHFTKNKKFKMYQDNVKEPIGDWAKKRLQKKYANDDIRTMSKTQSGFGRRVANWSGKRKVYPSNVIHFATVSSNKNHSAVFPERLPDWFIRLFTKKGDIVLDSFVGSGTTALATLKLDRKFIGIERNKKYYLSAKRRINMLKKELKI
ncbi:MAG: site-specific DNA-methyltransferase [Nanoarchaeota archaeon]|nr:site-specific DNA-methyltransferase [Nanoarchaeota archaeon]